VGIFTFSGDDVTRALRWIALLSHGGTHPTGAKLGQLASVFYAVLGLLLTTCKESTNPPSIPAAPSNLIATVFSNSQIGLTWHDNSSNEDGFLIERAPGGTTSFAEIGGAVANSPSYRDLGLLEGLSYSYRVRAYNRAGRSDYTDAAIATTQIAYGIIAYWSNVSGRVNDEIWLMNGDGTGETQIINTPSDGSFPTWSPDGTKIAYTAVDSNKFVIGVMNWDGTGQTTIDNGFGYSFLPSWSPSQRIAFTYAVFSDTNGAAGIATMNSDGSGVTRVTSGRCYASGCAVPSMGSWSPDGTKIAYRETDNSIHIVNADGTGNTTLNLTGGLSAFSPAWSRDGMKIAFAGDYNFSADTSQTDIFTMNLDGSAVTNVTNSPYECELYPSWSPDGKRIAYTRSPCAFGFHGLPPFATDVFVINADGTNRINLTKNSGSGIRQSGEPAWRP
jgi:hypothetical protein